MIDGLKPYPEYKDSSVPWLGEVPAHWELRKTKYLFQERSEKGFPNEPLLAATQTKGVVRKEEYENRTVLALKDLHLLKLVRVGDFVISLRSFQGGIEFARHQGIISPAYTILYSIDPAHQPFFAVLFKSKPYIDNLSLFVTGIRQGQNIDYKRLSNSILPVPSPEEQRAVARFLDHYDRLTRRYIRAQRRLIELLTEQKQALIQQAVTHGLDSDVPLKDSGIEWLGKIPSRFRRAKLGRLCMSIRDGTHNPPPAVPGVHRLLSVRNIVDGQFVIRADDRTMTPAAFDELQRSYTVNEGDVVLALVGGTTGKSAVVRKLKNVTVQRSIGIIRPNSKLIDSQFLNLVLRSELVQTQIRRIMGKYAAQPGIYLADVSALQIVFPDVEEQRAIVKAVTEQTDALSNLVDSTQHQINLIREYRTRLTADVVTGKLDVRSVSLPDLEEASDLGALDDLEEDAGLDDLDTEELNDADD